MRLNALVLAATVFVIQFAGSLPIAAEPALPGDETLYDLGYASRASETCSSVELLVKSDAVKTASEDFKKGAAMFGLYLDRLKVERACRAALNLYDSKKGKVARLLQSK
jgi:hypothetical protein